MDVGGEDAGEEEEGIDQCVVAETCEHHDCYWWDFWIVFVSLVLNDGVGFAIAYRICSLL